MPSERTVDAPIVLVGAGRSGTSLVSAMFERHPDLSVTGETVNLIFGVWYAMWFSAADIPPLVEDGRAVPDAERAGRLVRRTFVSTFPDDRPRWMQKPIGVPKALIDQYADDPGCDEAAGAYWRVLTSSFPRARFVTIVRQPCDVVLSGMAHWKFDQRTLWRTHADLARYLVHADAPPVHAFSYERLVREPEATARALFAAVDVPFDPGVLAAFDTIHVPAPGRPEPSRSAYARRDEWAALDPSCLRPAQRDAIETAYARFGVEPEWPAHWAGAPPAAEDVEEPVGARIARLEARAKALNTALERAHIEYAARARAREQEVTRVWTEQRDWIAELERVKTWLEEQRAYWQGEAERLRAER